MRITDQYFWNIVFVLFFASLVFMASVILESEAHTAYAELTFLDLALITLASFRCIRLVVYDKITAFFREQFYDVVEQKGKMLLVKPIGGPRRTLADLLTCPWCFGVWATAMITFLYLISPLFFYVTLVLALSAVATLLQLLANLIGWKAEQAKNDAE